MSLEAGALEERITRRKLVQLAGGVGLGLAAAACGGSPGGAGRSNVDGTKTLRVGISVTPTGVDPEFHLGVTSLETIDTVYENLTAYPRVPSPDDESILISDFTRLEGRLVDSWEVSEDGLSHTFRLRQGIKSAAGNELVADDVKWRWDRSFNLEGVGANFYNNLLRLDGENAVEVIDKYTVRFTSASRNALVPRILSVQLSKVLDGQEASKHATTGDPWATEWMETNAPGHGPYVIETWAPGDRVEFVARDDYYLGRPKIDRIIYKEIPNVASRYASLLSGDIDIAEALTFQQFSELQDEAGIKVVRVPSNQEMRLILNHGVPVLQNLEVRKALNHALPREDIIEAVYYGMASPALSYVSPVFPDYTDQFFAYDEDLDKARELLAAAGYPDGFDLDILYTPEVSDQEPVAIQLQTAYRSIGVNVTLTRQPLSAYNDRLFAQDFQAALRRGSNIVPDVTYAATNYWGATAATNFGKYQNPELEALTEQGWQAFDESERNAIAVKIQEVFMADVPDVFIAYPDFLVAMRDYVTGFVWLPENTVRFAEMDITT